jgi:hypothetical protein
MTWKKQAACAGVDINRFFLPASPGRAAMDDLTEVARRYCAPCPVRQECRAYADQHCLLGLYGGLYRRNVGVRYQATPLIPDTAGSAA